MAQRETVRSGIITEMTASDAVAYVDNVCTFGATSPDVQGSPVVSQALSDLTESVEAVDALLKTKNNLATALRAATKALDEGRRTMTKKLKTYEVGVDSIADGDAVVIAGAGLPTRPLKAGAKELAPVKEVHWRRGRLQAQALLMWPAAPGAGSYEVEVNFTSTDPAGPYTALTAASNQSRVVVAPTPGLRFVARVTAVGHDGTRAEASPPVLVTAA